MGAEAGVWGTWEELILGGAVMRHGTADWNAVASELRARTLYPFAFTPQACKERYEDLQKRYSGSTAWFDELRKQRVAELKLILAQSEDSIGSLESKIKSLIKSEKVNSSPAGYGSNGTHSPNNETSAGSFTKDTTPTNRSTTSWPCHNHLKMNTPLFSSEDGLDKNSRAKSLTGVDCRPVIVLRKRRGQRSRRDCGRVAEERSVGESDNLGCNNVVLSSNAGKVISGGDGELNEGSWGVEKDELIGIFRCVAETEPASVFRHRMDSQKRARYRKLIKQHVDIGTIKSRIIGKSIKSANELFRDFFLVANNALVFYSRRTREYKSALSLRQLVMREYKQHCMGSNSHRPTSSFIPCNPPVRPRTARPRPQSRALPCKEEKGPIFENGGLDKNPGLEDNKKPGSDINGKKTGFDIDNKKPGFDDKKTGFDIDGKKPGLGDKKTGFDDNRKPSFDIDDKKPGSGDKKTGFDDNRKPGFGIDSKKPGFSDGRLSKDKKGLKRPGKLRRGLVDGQSKNCVKQRKRIRR
ncbi:bromodomain 4 [Striga hermonthica]|uniref:Bromodomain 4 n=1 Tax=Striga hermonthica TaxID=68872 RepID=A0A9N7N863_STRHE|nr:bromodomain 4 [Striga hermonthica]